MDVYFIQPEISTLHADLHTSSIRRLCRWRHIDNEFKLTGLADRAKASTSAG